MIKNILIVLIQAFLILVPITSLADYYKEHAIGWHWYDDPVVKKEEKDTKQEEIHKKDTDPNVIVSNAKKRITTALNTAIVNPTIENVAEFIRLQEELNNRAEKFSNIWQEALLKNPKLNYSLTHPTNKIAIDIRDREASGKKDAVLKLFSQKTGLFFFYKSTCVYCKRFAPILKSFSNRYGIAVIGITLDGIVLPEFPLSRMDNGQAKKFQVTMTPSLYAVNPYNETAFPIAFGLVSEAELKDNIYNIMTKYGDIKL